MFDSIRKSRSACVCVCAFVWGEGGGGREKEIKTEDILLLFIKFLLSFHLRFMTAIKFYSVNQSQLL